MSIINVLYSKSVHNTISTQMALHELTFVQRERELCVMKF